MKHRHELLSRSERGKMNTSRRVFLGVAAWTGGISALHGWLNVDWNALRNSLRSRAQLQTLIVGGLPVTCNLTLPIACVARNLDRTFTRANFEYRRYNGWPEIKESLISGKINAAYMLAPLVMDLVTKDVPVKIVSIGHRSGAVIMVRTDSPYRKFQDLTGKRIAIPSRFAVDFLFLRKMLAKEGMSDKDLTDRRDGASRHARRALRQGGRRVLYRRAVWRRGATRRIRSSPAHDARRMAQLHLLRPHRAPGAHRSEPRRGAGPRQLRAGGRPLARCRGKTIGPGRPKSPPASSTSIRTRRSSSTSWKTRPTA